MPWRVLSLLTLLWVALFRPSPAHPMDEWFLDLQCQSGQGLTGQLRVPHDQVETLLENPFSVRSGDQVWELSLTPQGADDGSERTLVKLTAAGPDESTPLTFTVPEGLLDKNQSLVGFLRFGEGEAITMAVGPGQERTYLPPETSAGRDRPELSWFFRFGIAHIVEGYDHLLFLFCLLIAGGTFKHFLVVVTSFTVGHSLSLASSVLGYISLPSQLTESIIALSIVVAALYNVPGLLRDEKTTSITSRGVMALVFGLIHGLGFAGMLTEVGVTGDRAAGPLVAFNLGVEAGQLVLVAIFFPLLLAVYRWKHKRTVLLGCSFVAACAGFYWFFQRVGILN